MLKDKGRSEDVHTIEMIEHKEADYWPGDCYLVFVG